MKKKYRIGDVTEAHQRVWLAMGYNDMQCVVSVYASSAPYADEAHRPFESEQDIRERLRDARNKKVPHVAFPFRAPGAIELCGNDPRSPGYTTLLDTLEA